MSELLFFVLGILIGGLAAWYWVIPRARSFLVNQLAETRKKSARAIDHARNELAGQIEQRNHDLLELRTQVEQERQATATTQSRLQAENQRLQEQSKRLEKATTELTDTVDGLRSELSTANNQSFHELGQLQEIRDTVERLFEEYTRAVETIESRLLAAARRLKELGVSTLPEISGVEADQATPGSSRPPVEDHEVEHHEEVRSSRQR